MKNSTTILTKEMKSLIIFLSMMIKRLIKRMQHIIIAK